MENLKCGIRFTAANATGPTQQQLSLHNTVFLSFLSTHATQANSSGICPSHSLLKEKLAAMPLLILLVVAA